MHTHIKTTPNQLPRRSVQAVSDEASTFRCFAFCPSRLLKSLPLAKPGNTPGVESTPPPLHISATEDCAVCYPLYAPGYHHTCKSCIGGNKPRAVAGITIGLCIALVALGVVVANLVSVVTPGPATAQDGPGASPGQAGEANTSEGGASEKRDGPSGAVASNRLKETLGVWQHRVAKRFPLTVVKIVVVVWQIVTQARGTGVCTERKSLAFEPRDFCKAWQGHRSIVPRAS